MTTKARAERRRAEKASQDGHIRVTNRDIFLAREPLQKLIARALPVKTSFALAKLGNTLNGHLQTIEAVRNQIVMRYGKPVEGEPGRVSVSPDSGNYEKFLEEMDELLGMEVDVAAGRVMLPELVGGESWDIEASVIMALTPFVGMES